MQVKPKQKFTKNATIDPPIYLNVQFQVEPLITGISSSQTKFVLSKMLVWTPTRCVPSLESVAQV